MKNKEEQTYVCDECGKDCSVTYSDKKRWLCEECKYGDEEDSDDED